VFKLTPPVAPATKWSETVLYSFKGALGGLDGNTPEAGLIFDHKGALYGTTVGGGAALNGGTVFKLTPPVPPATRWRETILYSFKGGTDGANPRAGLVFDAKGALYGTTFVGGGAREAGTVFKLTPPVPPATRWRETVLHRFGAEHDGVNPLGGLVFDAEGVLYGTTDVGNTFHPGRLGTVFKLTPPVPPATKWSETILHGFPATNTDGAQPEADLIFDGNGVLYGTTTSGGKSDLGTVFRLDPISGSEAVLYSFKGGTDGENPHAGVVFDGKGALYGTTNGGGAGLGTVFKLDPHATVDTILYEFTGLDGQLPAAAVAVGANGVLYGTTSEGGSSNCNCGVVFELH
jgi:uncharacterized repeat protein (TIGR03803 family)